jgi:tetratricopeptide (TPR) repeat protein
LRYLLSQKHTAKTGGQKKALDFLKNYLNSYNSAQLYFLAGKFYYQAKDYQNAQDNFLSALRQNDKFFEAYLYLADININYENNLDFADALLEKAAAIKADIAAIDFLRSRAAYKRGNKTAAKNFALSAYKKSKTDFTRQETKKAADFFNAETSVKKNKSR